jgi:hypothetical protein
LFSLAVGDKYGYINKTGKVVIKPQPIARKYGVAVKAAAKK